MDNIIAFIGLSLCIVFALKIRTLQPIESVNIYFERAKLYHEYMKLQSILLMPGLLCLSWWLSSFAITQNVARRYINWFFSLKSKHLILWISTLSIISSTLISIFIMGCSPRILDGFNYWFQAKNFSLGQLYASVPPCAECFHFPFIIMHQGKWYGSVYPGYPILLIPGMLLGVPWLINPLLSALGIILTFHFAYRLYNENIAKISVFLIGLSPFYRMMSSIFMAHVPALIAVVSANIMLYRWVELKKSCGWKIPVIAGIALGFIYIIRPQAGAVATTPFFLFWLMHLTKLKFKHVILFFIILAVFVLFLAYYNMVLTGNPFVNARYFVDPGRRLGFGPDIGEPLQNGKRGGHTIRKGIQNLDVLVSLWNSDLLGWGEAGIIGGVFLCVMGAVLIKPVSKSDVLLIITIILNFILYLFYFTPSPNFGPRYLAETIPASIILTVVGGSKWLSLLRKLNSDVNRPGYFGFYSIVSWMLAAIVFFLPIHMAHYGKLPPLLKQNQINYPDHLTEALVIVPKDIYSLNVFTWNSPSLDGIVFIPDPGKQKIRELDTMFPGKGLYIIEKTKPEKHNGNSQERKYRLRSLE